MKVYEMGKDKKKLMEKTKKKQKRVQKQKYGKY